MVSGAALFTVLACAAVLLVSGVNAASADEATTWIAAAQGVLQRLIPQHSNNFRFEIVNATRSSSPLPGLENDYFSVSAVDGIVSIRGTNGVSLTSGAYWYLKNVTNCQVTWGNNGTGNQLSLPPVLPDVALTTVDASVPIRYGWNMCTFSYSGVWWDEARWQEEIDWMALHGVNFPLALTGQEYVWMKVFEDYNVSLSELESWFSGPAFLAWQRAGNIQGFAGPLSYHWITQQAKLQTFILTQMRSLGMKPILACFAGHVPAVAKSIWPNASFTQSQSWNNFAANETDVWYLDPADPLFPQLGALFTQKMIDIFGTDHYYSCDTFNEVDPKSMDHSYLRAASAAVHQSIVEKDPIGIWVMQAWLFHSGYWNNNPSLVEAYLSGVSNESMLILDLNSEDGVLATKYHQYYGKPWVWNMLHNYGGVRGVYGNLTTIATSPYDSLYTPGGTMIGLGFTPEAIEQNPVMYEMLTSTFWSTTPIHVQSWLKAYVRQRYGAESPQMWAAWELLFNAVYNQPGEPRSEIEWVPHWQQASFGWQNGDATLMYQAAVAFLEAVNTFPNPEANGPLMYDLVDIVRQATTMFFSDLHRQLSNQGSIAQSRTENVTSSLAAIGALQLDLIATLDVLFSTNPNYLLGVWTTRATNLGLSNETLLYLYNAKNQITLWGPDAQICDYAAKAWSGLYSSYYHRRWEAMIQSLLTFSEGTSPYWNSYQFDQQLLAVEKVWCSNGTTFPSAPTAGISPIAVAQQLIDKIHVSESVVTSDYQIIPNADGLYNDYQFTPTRGHNVEQLALLCNLVDDCAGFTASGYLKRSIRILNNTGSTLYVKQRSLKRSLVDHLHQPRSINWRDSIEEAVGMRSRLLKAQQERERLAGVPRNPREARMRRIPGHRAFPTN